MLNLTNDKLAVSYTLNLCKMKKIITLLLLTTSSYLLMGQEVKINTNLAVEADGTVRMDGNAMVWDDLRVPLSEPSTGTVKPEWARFPYGVSGSAPFINWFKASGIDEMYFLVQLPHNWKEGSDIEPHIHWVPSVNGETGPTVPRWGLQYSWISLGVTHSAYTTIYGSTIVPSEVLVASRHYLTDLGTIAGSGQKISSMLICRIFRDGDNGADTFAGLAGALEVDFHYQLDTFGSRLEYTK